MTINLRLLTNCIIALLAVLLLVSCETNNPVEFHPMSKLKSGMSRAEVNKVIDEYELDGLAFTKQGMFRLNEKKFFYSLMYCDKILGERLEGIGLHSYGEENVLYNHLVNSYPKLEALNIKLVEFRYPKLFKPDSMVYIYTNKLQIDDFNTLSCNESFMDTLQHGFDN